VYLSEQLGSVAKGWPPCLEALALTVLLVSEADKLTLGKDPTVQVPHEVLILMKHKEQCWLTNAHITKYQGIWLAV
jgi:hypothetical protein